MKKEDFIYISSILCSKLINWRKEPLKLTYNRILIIKLDEIGDVVNSMHVFELLKTEYPSAEITLWCKSFIPDLISSNPFIEKIVTSKKELTGKYDLIVDLRGTFESVWYALKTFPKYRVERGGVRLHNKYNGGQKHEVITNLQIIEPLLRKLPTEISLRLYYSDKTLSKVDSYLKQHSIEKFAILHCFARTNLRQWKSDRYVKIAEHLHEKYKLEVLFAGDKNEFQLISNIQDKLNFKTYNLSKEFNLSEFAALCSRATIFVGNESGPLHIATASKCKSLGLYGPGVPTTFYPWGLNSRYIHYVLDCNPCDQIHCVRPMNNCMDMITELEVENNIRELMFTTS